MVAPTLVAVVAAERSRGVVLVIDDDPVLGELLALALAHAGFEAVTPADRHAAVAVATDRGAAVVAAVCDLQLGSTNGIEIVRALRDVVPGLTAIVISGHSTSTVEAELHRAGTDAIVLQKPFRPAEMVAVLTAA